eukprot:jgi/Ulvmu1/2242/UM013_0089.1
MWLGAKCTCTFGAVGAGSGMRVFQGWLGRSWRWEAGLRSCGLGLVVDQGGAETGLYKHNSGMGGIPKEECSTRHNSTCHCAVVRGKRWNMTSMLVHAQSLVRCDMQRVVVAHLAKGMPVWAVWMHR